MIYKKEEIQEENQLVRIITNIVNEAIKVVEERQKILDKIDAKVKNLKNR